MMTSIELFWYLNAMWGTALLGILVVNNMFIGHLEDENQAIKAQNVERLEWVETELSRCEEKLEKTTQNIEKFVLQVEADKHNSSSSCEEKLEKTTQNIKEFVLQVEGDKHTTIYSRGRVGMATE